MENRNEPMSAEAFRDAIGDTCQDVRVLMNSNPNGWKSIMVNNIKQSTMSYSKELKAVLIDTIGKEYQLVVDKNGKISHCSLTSIKGLTAVHLYLYEDITDNIKKDDWYLYVKPAPYIQKCVLSPVSPAYARKIIATTNPMLWKDGLLSISNSSLNTYAEYQGMCSISAKLAEDGSLVLDLQRLKDEERLTFNKPYKISIPISPSATTALTKWTDQGVLKLIEFTMTINYTGMSATDVMEEYKRKIKSYFKNNGQ